MVQFQGIYCSSNYSTKLYPTWKKCFFPILHCRINNYHGSHIFYFGLLRKIVCLKNEKMTNNFLIMLRIPSPNKLKLVGFLFLNVPRIFFDNFRLVNFLMRTFSKKCWLKKELNHRKILT